LSGICDLDDSVLLGYLIADYEPKYKTISLHNVIDEEIRKTCKEYIRLKSIEMPNIDESNYFVTLPSTTKDAIFLFDKIINYVFINIEHMYIMGDTYVETMKDSVLEELEEENSKLVKQLAQIKESLSQKELEMSKLKGQVKTLQNGVKNDSYSDSLLERLFSQERQITKITNRYNQLVDKYNTLKDELNIEIKDDDAIVKLKEPDRDGKYLFIAHEKASFKNNILEMFPNAIFATSNENVHAESVDMVVIITSHITHPVYYGMKQQCKEKNIPFVHCPFTNTELIKGCMIDYLN
jgi:hypothetical protein